MSSSGVTVAPRPKLKEIALVFLKLGTTAFGGPAAHIAMMEAELVRKRQWLSHADFLDLIGAANLIPGPNSTEVAIHTGHKVGGWRGLLTAGVSFIVPAFLIVWLLAWFYVKYGSLPALQSVFLGIKPVILAVIAQAVWNLARTAVKDKILAALCLISLLLYFAYQNEVLILFAVALANLIVRLKVPPVKTKVLWAIVPAICLIPLGRVIAQANAAMEVPIESLFTYFAKVGSVLFGSGYVLIAFLQNDLVDHDHWLTSRQLLDAIAVGQFTPGPVFTTATFIGYLISGNSGAVAATVGIFVPAFFFVAISAPFIPAMRQSKWTAPILDGLNVASLSLMMGASLILAKPAVFSVYGAVAFLVSLILLTRFKVNSAWLVLAGGIIGIIA
jgi:chromate transporter